MWWVTITLLTIISLFSIITVFYALKRINQYETVLVRIQQITSLTSLRLKKLDASGSFESDDEIGFFFKEVKDMQNILDGVFETDNTEENTNAKEKV
tara:strand:- start:3131 stop:3421 length:291 start_codon:yes stop_codon:yes gene_type:complete